MTFPDLADLAKVMADCKIAEFSMSGVTIKLHSSAFGQAETAPQDPKAFLDMPPEDKLMFWSVEGEPEKRPEVEP